MMALVAIGKTLVTIGIVIALLGGLLWLSGGTLKNFPIGRLPGDILKISCSSHLLKLFYSKSSVR